MEYTENLNLKKPEESDYYNVEDCNGNMEILDDVIANDVLPNLMKKEIARFTSSGSYTIPDGVSEIDVYVVAAGCAGKGGMARLYTDIAVNAGDSFSYVVGAGTNSTTTYGGSTSFGTAAQIINDYSSLSTRDLYAASKSYNAVNPYDGRFYGQWSSMYPVTTEITPAGVKPTGGSAATGTYGEIGGIGATGTTITSSTGTGGTGGTGGSGLVGGVGGAGGSGYNSDYSYYYIGGAGGVGGTGAMCGGDGADGAQSYKSTTGGKGGKGGAATDYGGAGGDGGSGGQGATQWYSYGGAGGDGANGYAGGGAGGIGGGGGKGFDGDSYADSDRAGTTGSNGTGGSGLIIIYA